MAVKYREIASDLAGRIRNGEIAHSDRLPGEFDLAHEFSVSRGTIRQALATLQRHGLIETWTGAGSFVTYDGEKIEDNLSWSKALSRKGVSSQPKLIALGRVELPLIAARLGLPGVEFLVVERVRSTDAGEPITLERSRIPWRSLFETVLVTGLVDASLSATLRTHGLISVAGEESIGLAMLGTDDAALLGRAPGEAFLETEHTTYDVAGNVIEFVTSLLHPAHFRLQHSYGARL
ncbi:MAG: hypothetical protein B5766_02110 [Candidatus Lumbricidophila eiseniae]|uniref:HTH gntR-type domain-containing protein n=1 Tax=Candidatus Lumbricidiphila eiseniae TaxID=1969409 RepID=A0A2A6FU57_9MICO|nr:MAG: hypothetical protein B5766_02110 [Candidatus Lumbricidophila eiseniae]